MTRRSKRELEKVLADLGEGREDAEKWFHNQIRDGCKVAFADDTVDGDTVAIEVDGGKIHAPAEDVPEWVRSEVSEA